MQICFTLIYYTVELHHLDECPVSLAPHCSMSWYLISSFLLICFALFLSSFFLLLSLLEAVLKKRNLPVQGSNLKRISWYIRSPFHFPGMWPGSYWWRGIRRQRTGPEVKLLLCYCTERSVERLWQFYCGLWTRLALQALVHRRKKKLGDEMRSVCVHECKHVHVFYFHDFHSHIICHRIIQCFHFSSKYFFIIPSLSLSPDVLLHKLVEALQDAFRSDLRKRQTVPNYFF